MLKALAVASIVLWAIVLATATHSGLHGVLPLAAVIVSIALAAVVIL